MSATVFDSRSFRSVYAPWSGTAPANLLGCVRFGLGLQRIRDPRHVVVALEHLSPPGHAELWLSDTPVEHGWFEGFGYSHNGEVLFGSLFLPESELVDLERATLKTYVRLEQMLQQLGYPHYLRIWNFLAAINDGDGDAERYRLFSAGRNRALALKPDFERWLPAATAIGMLEPGLVIYFLAGKRPGQPVENPRQVAAYHYPRVYGPKSPSFARATLIGDGEAGARLLVSGTASVVGHESLHHDDPQQQLDETMRNIDVLIGHTLKTHFSGAAPALRAESLKLYLRDAAVLDALQARLPRLRGNDTAPLLCLRGDVCRHDLLLEIEASYQIAAAPA